MAHGTAGPMGLQPADEQRLEALLDKWARGVATELELAHLEALLDKWEAEMATQLDETIESILDHFDELSRML
ncbi:MAG: hypothetical protein OXM57_15230 [bacterium]|nr:hypothetical protein [bacterium]MDE0354031.1 hypothetical protein [bacterium]